MTGVSHHFVDTLVDLTMPDLEDFVRFQYGEHWQHEYNVISQWRHDHGITVIFDYKHGVATFCPGVEWAPLIHPEYLVITFP
jgi:hypothetical protein